MLVRLQLSVDVDVHHQLIIFEYIFISGLYSIMYGNAEDRRGASLWLFLLLGR
jgi:hypothetical protein